MVLIAENIHIISKTTKEAIAQRDDSFVLNILEKIKSAGFTVADLNIGPAKGPVAGAMEYLTRLAAKNSDLAFSFDTSNFDEIKQGFLALGDPARAENCFINSVCVDENKLARGLELAGAYNSNLVALAFSPDKGIAKSSDERLEYCFSIYERALQEGISPDKLYFDPLVLPVGAAQNQGNVVLETIRMLKEGMEDIHTVVGLSNISNGSPKELRPLLNRVFLVLCMACGLDSAILDALDFETIKIFNMLKANSPETALDKLYLSLYNAVSAFEPLDEVEFDKNDAAQANVIKAAKILTNQEIYSHSFVRAEG